MGISLSAPGDTHPAAHYTYILGYIRNVDFVRIVLLSDGWVFSTL